MMELNTLTVLSIVFVTITNLVIACYFVWKAWRKKDTNEQVNPKNQNIIEEQQQMLLMTSKMSALGEMAAGIAHEINNPLGIVKGYIKIISGQISNDKIDKEKAIALLNKCNNSIDRISSIIRGLHTYSRNSSKDPMSEVTVKELIDDTFGLCQRMIESENIQFSISYEKQIVLMGSVVSETPFPDQIILKCRPGEIVQVLFNLINNAKDAVLPLTEKWIKVKVLDTDESTTFYVMDSGKGIELDNVKKLMSPFFTTKAIGKGTGLGLSISKGIIEAHKGQLYYDTNSSNTTFVVIIPKSN